ncbi:MAG: hypothetical protein AMXMBFR34_00020 [Myxococcaceae bacterium]
MNRLVLSAALASSLAFAQGAPPPPAKAAPPPPAAKAPPPAPAPAAPAPAAAAPAAPAMDWTKVGPGSRKPKNEGAVKKELTAFLAEEDKLFAAKNWDGLLARIDFPVTMITDDGTGKVSSRATTKEQYVAEMKPFWESAPADLKVKHKPTITVHSDSLATVVDDFQMTMGKTKVAGKSAMTLVKVDGSWKCKVMLEAGWGGMAEGGGAPAPAPAPAPAKVPAPPPAPAKAPPPPGKAPPPPPGK